MAVFERLETISVVSVIKDEDGVLTDPATSTKITILDPVGTAVVNAVSMTKLSTGTYQHLYTSVVAAVLGSYHIRVTATDGAKVSIQDSEFTLEG